jgi:hypothetical protein
MGCGTAMVVSTGLKSAVYTVYLGGYSVSAYAAIFALALNFFLVMAGTAVLGTRGQGVDLTSAEDYIEHMLT